jgi:tRNA1Val (adenine37-N6)-methyltransferase
MSNSYFQFKQFTIEQDRCAMKVSTDACIQGAWTPVTSELKTALDIGTGTGLLSLMLVQRNGAVMIDAVEIDPMTTEQARENIAASSSGDRVQVIQGDIRQLTFDKKYDLIICNPPFFNNSLLGDKDARNKARHTLSLSFAELFDALKANLADVGYSSILLPTAEHQLWREIVEKNGWKIFHQLNIVPRVGEQPNRVVSLCGADTDKDIMVEDLVIRDKVDGYTPEFVNLLKPFYLKL